MATDTLRKALLAAVHDKDKRWVQELLDVRHIGNINIQDIYGEALYKSVYAQDPSVETIFLLLDQGTDINTVWGNYGTAFGAAARGGNETIVSLLLSNGGDINTVGGYYGTALGVAARGGNEEIVSLLLNRGADINTVGGNYGTALGVAACLGKGKVVSLLLGRGAGINTVGGNYGTALGAGTLCRCC